MRMTKEDKNQIAEEIAKGVVDSLLSEQTEIEQKTEIRLDKLEDAVQDLYRE